MQNNENSGEITNLVISQNETAITTSLKVAEVFSKHHKNVLKTIESLGCSKIFWQLNFKPRQYDNRGRLYPYYEITRQGFTILVMGFTGIQAMTFKEAYIDAFDKMENYIRDATSNNLLITSPPQNELSLVQDIEALKKMVENLVKEHQKDKQEVKNIHHRLHHMENVLENRPYILNSFPDAPLTAFYVYFALNPSNGLTKIGQSTNPEDRLWVFQAVEPNMVLVRLINVRTLGQATALEIFLHQLFSAYSRGRELFTLGEYQMNIVDLLKAAIEANN